jgi:hypothetical protein
MVADRRERPIAREQGEHPDLAWRQVNRPAGDRSPDILGGSGM